MAEEWLRKHFWGEGRSKTKPRAKISTFTVRSSKKTAGRKHMNLFVRLVVLSEGGSMFPAAQPQGYSSSVSLVCCCSSPGAVQTQLQIPAGEGGTGLSLPPSHTHRGTNPGLAGSGAVFI